MTDRQVGHTGRLRMGLSGRLLTRQVPGDGIELVAIKAQRHWRQIANLATIQETGDGISQGVALFGVMDSQGRIVLRQGLSHLSEERGKYADSTAYGAPCELSAATEVFR